MKGDKAGFSRFAARALFAVLLLIVAPLVDAAVVEAWVHRYNGPADKEDYPAAVTVDPAGNVIVTGYSINQSAPYHSIYTAKYASADGALLWEHRRDSASNVWDEAWAVAADASGNVVVAGFITTGDSGRDYFAAKYAAADGAPIWEKTYDVPSSTLDQAQALAIDADGNVVVTGYSSADSYTVKYAAADGAVMWEKRTGLRSDDRAYDLALDSHDNVIISGYYHNTNSVPPGGSATDYYTAKYAAADGALLWERTYNSPDGTYDSAAAVVVDGMDNVIVTGTSLAAAQLGYTGYDFYTAKYAGADGALLWEKRFSGPGPGHFYDFAQALAVDGNNNVVVTGISYTFTNSHTFVFVNRAYIYTAKYAAADGALLWEKRHDALGRSSLRLDDENFSAAIAVDNDDNVVVTGSSVRTNLLGSMPFPFVSDYYTVKYSGRDGAPLWETTYASSGASSDAHTFSDVPTGIALGSDGSVVVTGSSMGDFATVVYREVPPSVSIRMTAAGARLQLAGTPTNVFQVERARSVSGPWEITALALSSPSGFIEYIDTNSPPGTAFYRIRKQ